MIFFSLTEAPLPDPTQHPEKDPKRTRNRAETEPNGAKRSRNGAKRSRNGPKSSFSGWDGRGLCRGRVGGGVVREKENHYPRARVVTGYVHSFGLEAATCRNSIGIPVCKAVTTQTMVVLRAWIAASMLIQEAGMGRLQAP